MKKLKISIHDAETGEITERDLTAEELLQHEADLAEINARLDAAENKAQAKAALLDRLGITEDEAKLLLS